MTTQYFAGELTAAEAYATLRWDRDAVLIDVRTLPEWQFVGVPDLRPLERTPLFVSWQLYPEMRTNERFVQALVEAGVERHRRILLLCRSGARSRAAARALAAAGYTQVWNISDGFEGNLDAAGHRGRLEGWRASGLPWVQQ